MTKAVAPLFIVVVALRGSEQSAVLEKEDNDNRSMAEQSAHNDAAIEIEERKNLAHMF